MVGSKGEEAMKKRTILFVLLVVIAMIAMTSVAQAGMPLASMNKPVLVNATTGTYLLSGTWSGAAPYNAQINITSYPWWKTLPVSVTSSTAYRETSAGTWQVLYTHGKVYRPGGVNKVLKLYSPGRAFMFDFMLTPTGGYIIP
jgi:hypothetical protein